MDVQRTLAFIDAIDRAFLNACLVLNIHTRLRDYVRHVPGLSTLGSGVPPALASGGMAGLLTSEPIISQPVTANLAGVPSMNW
jgi:hypothetical protein